MIHPTALVSDKAKLGRNVSIGPYSIVHDAVILDDDVVVEAYCEIGYPTPLAGDVPLVIGKGARIRSQSVFYQGSCFGSGLVTGHRVMVREKTVAGSGLHIGNHVDIQGDCRIGHHVHMHSSIQIGKESAIGNFVWIFPDVLLTNDPNPPSMDLRGPIVEDYAVIASKALLMPGVRIGRGALVGAQSLVNQDVEPGMVVSGSPAKKICRTSDLRMKDKPVKAYPWWRRFHRGYPTEIVEQWLQGIDEVRFGN